MTDSMAPAMASAVRVMPRRWSDWVPRTMAGVVAFPEARISSMLVNSVWDRAKAQASTTLLRRSSSWIISTSGRLSRTPARNSSMDGMTATSSSCTGALRISPPASLLQQRQGNSLQLKAATA